MEFKQFAKAVNYRFNELVTNHKMLRTNSVLEEIKETYLNAFPAGTNPMYITNTQHDCTCCKNFIRNVGGLVAIKDGAVLTVWDVNVGGAYQVVADKMAEYIKSKSIHSVFYASERKYGLYENTQTLDDGRNITWNHFHADMPSHLFKGDKVGEQSGRDTTAATMLTSTLDTFTDDAVSTVLDLIQDNAIYRGEEHLNSVKQFKELMNKYKQYTGSARLFGFEYFNHPAARFKNTVIGTLIEDISKGMELESAVKSFESKVAPSNYKRSKSLITPGMINEAMKTITELDLEPALERRHATLHDMNINDILWSDVSVQGKMKGGVQDLLMQSVKAAKPDTSKATEISIADFMSHILPQATKIDALVENRHQSNFMNIIAPVNEATNMLKWDNNFTWSYNGNVTDSMKEVVKSFGGKIEAQLRCSIMWNEDNDNKDDLDLHCDSPYGHIYYANKGFKEFNLDVDIQNPGSKVAVENITHDFTRMKEGKYEFYVHNYTRRGSTSGFKAEIEFDGQVFEYYQATPVTEDVKIADVTVSGTGKISIKHFMSEQQSSKEIYSLKTNDFVKVTNVMLSPNHWNGQSTGNKHFMFVLEGCKTNEQIRGFYNEFLSEKLTPHRKVFEILSAKTKVEPSDEQLAGLGFSSTVRNDVVLRVSTSNSTKMYKVQF